MSKLIKRGLLITVIVLVISFLLFVFRQHSFVENGNNGKMSITYIKIGIENSQAVNESITFEYSPEESDYQNIVAVLNKYSYHASLQTLFGDGSIHGNTETFVFSFENNNNPMVLSNVPNVIIGTNTYKVGYMSDTKILEMIKELRVALGIE